MKSNVNLSHSQLEIKLKHAYKSSTIRKLIYLAKQLLKDSPWMQYSPSNSYAETQVPMEG